jgi:hypothetical protein
MRILVVDSKGALTTMAHITAEKVRAATTKRRMQILRICAAGSKLNEVPGRFFTRYFS